MTDTIIEAKGVTRTFMLSGGLLRQKRPLHAVNGVDLVIERGEVMALVGESGCGKTTLAKMMMGLLAPSRGAILLEGRPITEVDRITVARTVQPVFPDP